MAPQVSVVVLRDQRLPCHRPAHDGLSHAVKTVLLRQLIACNHCRRASAKE
jgi:hypothetical protein